MQYNRYLNSNENQSKSTTDVGLLHGMYNETTGLTSIWKGGRIKKETKIERRNPSPYPWERKHLHPIETQ